MLLFCCLELYNECESNKSLEPSNRLMEIDFSPNKTVIELKLLVIQTSFALL